MHSDFKEWLGSVVSPERNDVLTTGFTLIETINGSELEEITHDILTLTNVDDTFELIAHTEGECLKFSDRTLQRFGVRIRNALLVTEHQHLLNALLTTLSTADAYELPDELLSILLQSDTPEEALALLTEAVTGVDAVDIQDLLDDVSPGLMSTLQAVLEEQTQQVSSDDEVKDIDKEALERFLMRLRTRPTGLTDQDPIVRYVTIENGTLGLSIANYVTYFQSTLGDLSDAKLTAERWVLTSLIAGIAKSDIPEQLGLLMERLAFDVEDTMRIRPHVLALLKEF